VIMLNPNVFGETLTIDVIFDAMLM
jgi:hypothetical protein